MICLSLAYAKRDGNIYFLTQVRRSHQVYVFACYGSSLKKAEQLISEHALNL